MPSEQFSRLSPTMQRKILTACLREFARHGYDAASTNRMVQEAGISKGALFKYFTDKEHLFNAVYQQAVSDMQEALGLELQEDENIFGLLSRLTVEKVKYYKSHPDVYQFMTHLSKHQNHPVYARVYSSTLNSAEKILKQMVSRIFLRKLRPGVTIEHVVSALIWISDGLLHEYLNRLPDTAENEQFDAFYEQLFTELKVYFSILQYGIYQCLEG